MIEKLRTTGLSSFELGLRGDEWHQGRVKSTAASVSRLWKTASGVSRSQLRDIKAWVAHLPPIDESIIDKENRALIASIDSAVKKGKSRKCARWPKDVPGSVQALRGQLSQSANYSLSLTPSLASGTQGGSTQPPAYPPDTSRSASRGWTRSSSPLSSLSSRSSSVASSTEPPSPSSSSDLWLETREVQASNDWACYVTADALEEQYGRSRQSYEFALAVQRLRAIEQQGLQVERARPAITRDSGGDFNNATIQRLSFKVIKDLRGATLTRPTRHASRRGSLAELPHLSSQYVEGCSGGESMGMPTRRTAESQCYIPIDSPLLPLHRQTIRTRSLPTSASRSCLWHDSSRESGHAPPRSSFSSQSLSSSPSHSLAA